jgi:DNA mismatch repair protein MutL
LSTLLANQIAAGEVVERPASVVKELLDNAIDAGATRVVLELEQGGIELLRVSDDGSGIPAEELPLAIAPHATSKLREPSELERIGTMGFRGEALASIASVSRLSIRSRTSESNEAALIEIEGDIAAPVRPTSGPSGTSVTVRNLFFNTPARRKFLRTPATEQGRCLDILRELAMSHPGIAFAASVDGRSVIDLPPADGPRMRMIDVLGKELATQLLTVEAGASADALGPGVGVSLWGLVGLPAIARATASAQHVFVNGRPIKDRTIQHAIKEAYRGLIEPGRYPTACLLLDIDPSLVDVNVHPAKSEVRFRDSSLIHGLVLRTIRDALRAADLTPVVQSWHGARNAGAMLPGSGVIEPKSGEQAGVSSAAFAQYSQRADVREQALDFGAMRQALRASPMSYASGAAPSQSAGAHAAGLTGEASIDFTPPLLAAPVPRTTLQVHNSFLVTQDEHGLVIIDQHALHERVMFEKLLARLTGPGAEKSLESQRLLTPATIECGSRGVEAAEEMRPLLERIGIELTPIGPGALAVNSFATFLFERRVEAGEFVSELIERAMGEGFALEPEAALSEVLDMMACKAAIKAGDQLAPSELEELLRLREQVERSSNCPHGRPTSIRLTIKELEKRFGRA